jgi:hypothetical protein
MSNVFVTDINGTGIYAVPGSDVALAAAEAGLAALIGTVPGLTYSKVFAWVKDSDGGSARTLNCLVANAQLGGAVCPDATDTQTLMSNIQSALEGDPNITSVSVQESNLVDESNGGILPGITNTIFVAKGSNTIEDGTLENPYHTFTAALAEAASRIPSVSNPQTIWGYPAIYAESFTVPNFVSIEAPGSRIDGNIILGDSVDVRVKEVRAATGIAVLKPAPSAGTARFEAEKIVCTGSAFGAVNLGIGTGSVLICEVKSIFVEEGVAVGDFATDVGHMHIMCEDIYITGAGGVGVARSGAGTTEGYVAHILEVSGGVGLGVHAAGGDIDLFCHRIVTTAALIVGAGATLRLTYSVLTGSQSVTGTLLTSFPT